MERPLILNKLNKKCIKCRAVNCPLKNNSSKLTPDFCPCVDLTPILHVGGGIYAPDPFDKVNKAAKKKLNKK
jgi:hypothetical protein